MSEKKPILVEIEIPCPRWTIMEKLADGRALRSLFEGIPNVGVVADNESSPYPVGWNGTIFTARFSGTDLLLSARGCSIGIRAKSADDDRCLVMAAVSGDPGAAIRLGQDEIEHLLVRLRQLCMSSADNAPAIVYDIFPKKPEASTPVETAPPSGGSRRAGRSASKRRLHLNPFLAAGLAICILLGLFALLHGGNIGAPSIPGGYAVGVTAQNFAALKPGMTEREIADILGTTGVRQGDGRVYIGAADPASGQYLLQLLIVYDNGMAGRMTWLDLQNAARTDRPKAPASPLSAEMTISDLEVAVGLPASMVRRYVLDGETVTETHFGFLDPFANFDPAWRGEVVIVQSLPAMSVSTAIWPHYAGGDPLLVDRLEGHSLANQFDSYSDYLRDRYEFQLALEMRNLYSPGDVQRVYGDITLYEENSATLYFRDAADLLPDGEPVSRMTFAYDSQGYFVLYSYTNMRLLNRAGMLAGSRYDEVTRGMSQNDVAHLMGVLPTAVLIDRGAITFCYGRRLETDAFEEQFELIVRFNLKTGMVENLFDNTTRAALDS